MAARRSQPTPMRRVAQNGELLRPVLVRPVFASILETMGRQELQVKRKW